MNSVIFGGIKKLSIFTSVWAFVFACMLSTAHSVGFVPYYVDGTEARSTHVAIADLPELGEKVVFINPVVEENSESVVSLKPIDAQTLERVPDVTAAQVRKITLPDRIIIGDIALDLPVLNPDSRDIAELDEVLKKGPVRYVDAAKLGENGNVLIFAHTSHLPMVHNKMYKAFNRVPELTPGATITLRGEEETYTYKVLSVRRVKAEDELIDLSPSLGNKLTLVTCDTLTSKSSRFILEAELVE